MLNALMGMTVLAVLYALYKHATFAQIRAVVVALETVAVTDAKLVIAAIKAKV